jgi:hypothetical protein
MALSNLRLGFIYGSARIGLGSAGTSTACFIDASRAPFRIGREGGRLTFGCEVVVSEADQATFNARCASLESAFDPAQSRNGTLILTSDTQVYQYLDPNGGWAYVFANPGGISFGNTFTLTVNGTPTVLTAGVDFGTGIGVATNLAVAIATTFPTLTTAIFGNTLYVYAKASSVSSLALATNASGIAVQVTNSGTLAFNTGCSIAKRGAQDDTALSRRYVVEISFDLAYSESGKNGRHSSSVTITETDSRRRRLALSGTYTALGSNSAYEQYLASIDTYAGALQTALGGTWEGPFDVKEVPDDNYAPGGSNSNRLGKILNYARTYEELIYNQSKGTLDDVRLRRQVLKVKKATDAPGDYGPGGQLVLRLQRGTLIYAAAVNKTQTQDLKAIYDGVVKPFLIDEAAKAFGTSNMALVFHEPELDRAENRIACSMTILAASTSGLLESSVVTRDEDDDGKTLVAVWDGDPYSKEVFDGSKTLRRIVTQTYTILGGPSGAKSSGTAAGGANMFGVFALNGPSALFGISAPNAQEADIDNFFGLPSTSSRKNGDAAFAKSGGVPEPTGFQSIYRNGVAIIEPKKLGKPGEPQLDVTRITKIKVFEYIHTPSSSGGPNRSITQAFNGSKGGDAGGPLSGDTVSR